jgi:hypothetical protein
MLSRKLFLSSATLFVLVSLPFIGCVWASSAMWSQTYESVSFGSAYSVVETSDGGYVVAGGSWLVKFDSQGRPEWDQTYSVGFARSVVTTSDGGYAIFGDGLLIKTDEHGNMIWNQTYGGNMVKGHSGSFAATSDGGYAFVVGSRLTKTDSQGNVEWNQTYEVKRATERGLLSLAETSDGGYVLVGHAWFMMSGDTFIWAVKTDAQGIIPEFPSWTILPLLVFTIILAIIYRKKLAQNTNLNNNPLIIHTSVQHIRSLITEYC